MTDVLCIAVVGHTNAGKTSLLRTLTRRVDFGEVSSRPGATRHAEAVDLRLDGVQAVRFIDTPGLEDAVSLLEYLHTLPGDTRLARVQAFLNGPEAHGLYEQEAKVLRALTGPAHAAMYVIDTREPVLPKHRAEIDILRDCARPVLPVLNFTRDAASRATQWEQALLESGLHARVRFDVVAPFLGAEHQLYTDLGTLLPARRTQLQHITDGLAAQARQREQAACRVVANALIDVAAMRRRLPATEAADPARQRALTQGFEDDVRRHAWRAVDELLAVFAFRPGDAELADLPELSGHWDDELFNPELLKQAAKSLGMGAAVGAGVGAVADLALAGLSLGAATTLGATLGGIASGGWRPVWRRVENRLNGVQELTAQDPMLLLLAERLLALTRALASRGHAAQDKLRMAPPGSPPPAGALRPLLKQLAPARTHPQWERDPRGGPAATATLHHPQRQAQADAVAQTLSHTLTQGLHTSPPAPGSPPAA